MNPLNTYLDHTLLKADARPSDILAVTAEAKEYHTASVCVNACYASLVATVLSGTGVKTCVVVGFPLGAMSSGAKAAAAQAMPAGQCRRKRIHHSPPFLRRLP